PADAGDLNGTLIEDHLVDLRRLGAGPVSRNRDVDRLIKHERHVDDASMKGSVTAIPGAAAAGQDVKAGQAETRSVTGTGNGNAAACRPIAVPAVPPDAADLDGALMKLNGIVLMGVGCGVRAGDGHIDRIVHRGRSVNRSPDEVAVA